MKRHTYRVWYHFEPSVHESFAMLVTATDDHDAEHLAYAILRKRGDGDASIDRVEKMS